MVKKVTMKIEDNRDQRVHEIINLISELASGNLGARLAPKDVEDDLEAIVVGLNMLAEELTASTISIASLKEKVEEELQKSRQKDYQIFEHARQRDISDLLINIAHHWRQPLNVIGVTAQDIMDVYTYDELDAQYLETQVKTIMNELIMLSDTISTFNDLYFPNKTMETFAVSEAIRKSIALITPYMKRNRVNISLDLKEGLTAYGKQNDFSQTIINILKNSVEVFLGREIEERRITITTRFNARNKKSIITISDNGGGIKSEIMQQVFEPYFTTGFKTTGKGLGLYFAKKIIETEMNGVLSIHNNDEGAVCTIEV